MTAPAASLRSATEASKIEAENRHLKDEIKKIHGKLYDKI
jgi:hypothetical protein